jgi:hypothetical protein
MGNNPVSGVDPDGRWVKGAGFWKNIFYSDETIRSEWWNGDPNHTFEIDEVVITGKYKMRGSRVDEYFIQLNLTLGLAGPSFGISVADLPNGTLAIYWNRGGNIGVDIPNIDIGISQHTSLRSRIDWQKALEGDATEYGGSISMVNIAYGGNHAPNITFPKPLDYETLSVALNIGPNDLAGGATKLTTQQKYLFSLPGWLIPRWEKRDLKIY